MRKLFVCGLVTAAATLVLFGETTAGRAWGYPEGPWCATFGGSQGAIEDCRMLSFEMCREEITGGNRGSCSPNPHWPGNWPQRSGLKRRG